MSTVKTTNIEEVLPNDVDLGRRNCSWRELLKKYEDCSRPQQNNNEMDIDAVMVMLDQDMSEESTVSGIVEASSEEQSAEENADEIERQLQQAVPIRRRQWEANGLKEILDDNEFKMLSHEKVANWLQNHMHSITGQYNVQQTMVQTQQVTTVTETHMDADADSLYSVDTAQYIRSNKQISNKMKVTTMIKRYSVTSSVRRMSCLGIIMDEQQANVPHPERLAVTVPRPLTRSDSAFDVKKPLPQYIHAVPQQPVATGQHRPTAPVHGGGPTEGRNRRKVFKKTVPRRRHTSFDRSFGKGSPRAGRQRYDAEQLYAKALEQCGRVKKTTVPRRKKWKKMAARTHDTTTSSSIENDSDEVFWDSTPAIPQKPPSSVHVVQTDFPTVPTNANRRTPVPADVDYPGNPTPNEASPTEREILEPFQSITLSTPNQQRSRTPGRAITSATRVTRASTQPNKADNGCVIIYRPKVLRPHCESNERISLRVGDLTLTGVTKQRHLAKFQTFNYRVHPNSTVCFYPSDSEDDDGEMLNRAAIIDTDTENSYDDDDPILTFNPRHSRLLNVVEIPYRRPVA